MYAPGSCFDELLCVPGVGIIVIFVTHLFLSRLDSRKHALAVALSSAICGTGFSSIVNVLQFDS